MYCATPATCKRRSLICLQRLESSVDLASSQERALELTIQAAELCMRALKLEVNKKEKAAWSSRCKWLLNQAEDIKLQSKKDKIAIASDLGPLSLPIHEKERTSTSPGKAVKTLSEPLSIRHQSNAEQIIVLRASKLNGSTFPPWKDPPSSDQFRNEDGGVFEDSADLGLSQQQAELLAGWYRPNQALPPPAWPTGVGSNAGPSMRIDRRVDLVQDAATDCSVVASLCSGTARVERGHTGLLVNILYPYDHNESRPATSANGRYVLRMNFNGCYRRVTIDDRLPVSKSQHMLHVVDRADPSLLWPALVEKAYLKVRGGYGFPGSNPSTDLWIIVGWIPEHVFMQE